MIDDRQGTLFGEGRMQAPTRSGRADPDAVRQRLHRLLAKLRAAETMPLSDRDARMWQMVVPNMTKWLPEPEAEDLRTAFAREFERLRPAA